jgi:hypothetical protein
MSFSGRGLVVDSYVPFKEGVGSRQFVPLG